MSASRTIGGGSALAALIIAAGVGAIVAARRKSTPQEPDSAPGHTARRGFGKYDVTGFSVTIAKPRQELFDFWRDFQNLPQFMENVVKVVPTGGNGRSIWTIRAPLGRTVDVETEVVKEEAGRLIAWRSVEGSDIDTEGRVAFDHAPGDRGTRVSVIVAYKPPAGEAGRLVAKMTMREPEVQARHDLKRFKMLMETGEIATSARTKSGTRASQMKEA